MFLFKWNLSELLPLINDKYAMDLQSPYCTFPQNVHQKQLHLMCILAPNTTKKMEHILYVLKQFACICGEKNTFRIQM